MKPIHTEEEYKIALQRAEELFDSKKGTSEGDELEVLLILIDKYEKLILIFPGFREPLGMKIGFEKFCFNNNFNV